jgi:hypothetical protein
MPWAAAGAVVGGLISSSASKRAGDKQSEAAAADRAYQESIFDKQTELQEPWREAGVDALGQLTDPAKGWGDPFTLQDFQASPGFTNRVAEGQKAIERSAALKGSLQSGKTLKAITRWGQEQGSDEFQRSRTNWNQDKAIAWDQLTQLAGFGTGATTALGGNAGQLGTRATDTFTSQGNAGAAGTVGAANAWTGAANQIGDWYAKKNNGGNSGTTVPTWGTGNVNWGDPGVE